ncbi:MAG: dephospho-CoA kinase [Pseudomonadota bacterium]|nr:dephospho-CoA kinase [Pseudomonadota bacterium]
MSLVIGLTGGIGSGKTAASDWFAQQGIMVVDADVAAREVVAIGQPALQQIQTQFGDWALLPDGSLNRRAMRDYVFAHPEARQQLEAITHPLIRQHIIQQLQQAQSPYVLLVSPLLFETNQHALVEQSILIDVPETLQLERAGQRDGQSPEAIQNIINAQMSRAERHAKATHIIVNDQDLPHLYQALGPLHQQLLQQAMTARNT